MDSWGAFTLAVILIQRDNFVYNLFWRISPPLRLFDLFRVSALLDDEVEYVKHVCDVRGFRFNKGKAVVLVKL